MLKRSKVGARRTAKIEVEGQSFQIALWPFSDAQNIVMSACGLEMDALRAEGIWNDEAEAEACAGEDAEALDRVWGHVPGDRAALRARLHEIQNLLLKHFVLDCKRAAALPRPTRYKLVTALLARLEAARTPAST